MFVHQQDLEYEPCGEGIKRKILGHGGSMMMVEVVFDKGAIGADHTHPHEQVSYIVKGSFKFHIEEEEHVVKAGDSLYIPSQACHGTEALEKGSVILDVFTPQREDFKKV